MLDIPTTEILILAPFVLLAYTNEAITGFGAALIVITLGANFIPIDILVPVVVPLNVIVTATVAYRHRQDIDRRLLLTQIIPFMGAGLVAGILIYPLMKGVALKWLLGVFVLVFSGRQLWLLYSGRDGGNPISTFQAGFWQILAGITHAFYSAGGPLLTYSISRLNLPKGRFRATLCAVWAMMNSALIVFFVLNGRLNTQTIKITVPLVILLPVGIRLGEWLHDRIGEQAFRVFIYGLLFLSGFPLVFK